MNETLGTRGWAAGWCFLDFSRALSCLARFFSRRWWNPIAPGVGPGDAGVIGFRERTLIMASRLRFHGTGSGGGSCPAVHEDLDTGEVIVHGPRLTAPETL